MTQAQIQNEIRRRLYCWAQATIRREVAEDFPILRNCRLNGHVRYFLAWMNTMDPAERLRICLLLAKRYYQSDREANDAFEQYRYAISSYSNRLGPEPDYDVRAPGFVKADIEKCKEAIYTRLEPVCGAPRRRQRQKIWYIQKFGDWYLTTLIEMTRGWGPDVYCYHFLRRADFDNPVFRDSRYYHDDMATNIDPLIILGISWSRFALIGRSHEKLSAESVLAVTEPIVRSIPKLVEGLEIHS